jgi:hypothetical protein
MTRAGLAKTPAIASIFLKISRETGVCFLPDPLPVILPVSPSDIRLLSARTNAPRA